MKIQTTHELMDVIFHFFSRAVIKYGKERERETQEKLGLMSWWTTSMENHF
jgi:hypothetical protein